jgi:acyl carrier protein
MDQLEQQVIEIIAKKKKVDPSTISLDSSFQELAIDSLDGMDLIFTFEDTFNISVPDNVVQQMKGVREVVAGLRQELAKPSSPPQTPQPAQPA